MSESPNRVPAPGALRLIQAFLNTRDPEADIDLLRDSESARAWLRERRLIDPDTLVSDADLPALLRVREALRSLAAAGQAGETDPDALETLSRVARTTRLAVRFRPDGRAELEPDLPGVDGALGRLLGVVYTAMIEGTWSRLKICRREACGRAFYDRSKNRSASWCSMAVCGNREKARTYRLRRAARLAGEASRRPHQVQPAEPRP